MTFGKFAEEWTSNRLAPRFHGRVKEIDHEENMRRLRLYILSVVYEGEVIADTPLSEFTLDHADFIMEQESIPAGSVRHVAQVINRVLRLAVTPAKILKNSPIPPGWLPAANPEKARSYLFPSEDARLMQHREIPLVKRLYVGIANREGPRRGNLVNLQWADLILDLKGGEGFLTFDTTKTGRDAKWVLDPGTAEALRRWRRICPSRGWRGG